MNLDFMERTVNVAREFGKQNNNEDVRGKYKWDERGTSRLM